MALDKATKDNIIVAAITGAGPVGDNAEAWEAKVLAGARKITAVLSDPESVFVKAIDEIDSSTKFVALLSLVKKEAKSTRGVLYFQDVPRIENGVSPAPLYTSEQIQAAHAIQVAARAAGTKSADMPKLPEGLEALRTERTDSLDGYNMAQDALGLIGHRVLVYKVIETMKTNPNLKVRVVRLVTDLGKYDGYVVPVKAAPVAVAAA
ncbi:hypothetical protein F1C58_16720 (plasmid) [Glaciihabitans sp. INWT7]|uniref:hypothetical protein n=1 Tax=Glaciihabitans sp. INWT7 TaxID=2596912 RepID=UPI001623A62A|nr:hypothetical protein [Glaciihabitans sp. INWT7]QNE48701.1 hypothetical protein F1C58_16720 [Glaciihabitans sp. INWT7]